MPSHAHTHTSYPLLHGDSDEDRYQHNRWGNLGRPSKHTKDSNTSQKTKTGRGGRETERERGGKGEKE